MPSDNGSKRKSKSLSFGTQKELYTAAKIVGFEALSKPSKRRQLYDSNTESFGLKGTQLRRRTALKLSSWKSLQKCSPETFRLSVANVIEGKSPMLLSPTTLDTSTIFDTPSVENDIPFSVVYTPRTPLLATPAQAQLDTPVNRKLFGTNSCQPHQPSGVSFQSSSVIMGTPRHNPRCAACTPLKRPGGLSSSKDENAPTENV